MAVTIQTSGAQAATVGATHTLFTVTGAGVYQFLASVTGLQNGATGDLVIFEFWTKGWVGATSRLETSRSIGPGAQSEKLFRYIPMMHAVEFKVKLRQSKGTSRTFGWSLLKG